MNLSKLVTDAEKLVADIKAATDKAGADGAKINLKEWAGIAKDASALLGDIVGVIPVAAALLG